MCDVVVLDLISLQTSNPCMSGRLTSSVIRSGSFSASARASVSSTARMVTELFSLRPAPKSSQLIPARYPIRSDTLFLTFHWPYSQRKAGLLERIRELLKGEFTRLAFLGNDGCRVAEHLALSGSQHARRI